MAFVGRYVRVAAAHRAESLADELDALQDVEAGVLVSLDSIVAQLRRVINRSEAEAFGNQCAEALSEALHDERSRLRDALAEAEQEAGDEI